VVGILTFLADLWALAWVGLWTGLVSRVANRAAGTVVALVLGVPWILFLAVVTLLAWGGVSLPEPQGYHLLGLYVILGVGVDVIAYSAAQRWLYGRLRSVATQRLEPGRQPGWLSWILGGSRGQGPTVAAVRTEGNIQ
jgi:hypothetical protein